MNCPYCNKNLGSGLSIALSHDCCAQKSLALNFKEGKTIGYVYYRDEEGKSFKIVSSSYMNVTIVYIVKVMDGVFISSEVFTKVNAFIHPKHIDKKLKTILVFS